ncbi:hypothetical protein OA84_05330 [Kaistella solincola]|uniref:PKD domain-containing protein n=1 Tax=Kaistella solincola TaxID=510955 RepID=A0ABR4ZQL5_9FLAO|nr:hypothetical protein [Kaistella solincola]KIA82984.1 hypothetical protein OA84_05330 [Kaistella solincola]
MKFKFLFFLFLAMAGFVSAQTAAPAPQLGDFKSVANGAWTDPATWQIYNGSTWENTITEYPGKSTTSATPATYSVFVEPGTNVSVSGDQIYYFGNLYILADPAPSATNALIASYGKVSLAPNGSSLSLLGNNQDLVILGGILDFQGVNTELKLKRGNSIVLQYYNGAACGTGTNLLQPEAAGATGNKKIIFVDGTSEYDYAVSGGAGNSAYNFSDLNCNGGTVSPVPAATLNPVCAGKTTILSTTLTGFISAADLLLPKSYIWSLVSGPTGYTFTPVTLTTAADLSLTFTAPGTYVFNVELVYLNVLGIEISASQTITIEVLAAGNALCGGCFKDPVTDAVKNPSIHGITSLKRAGVRNPDNWPMVRESAYTVLESNSKGFVINRLTTTQLNAIATAGNAVDGMMAYDTTEKCLKLYVVDLVNPANTGWSCFNTPACPN